MSNPPDWFLKFTASVSAPSAFACWIWTGTKNSKGYGSFYWAGKVNGAHRFAYEFANGNVGAGLDVMHACDIRDCVNPMHMSTGTRTENMQDMVTKERSLVGDKNPSRLKRHCIKRGETHHAALLNRAIVAEIKSALLHESQVSVAGRFGLDRRHVGKIARGQLWAHVKVA